MMHIQTMHPKTHRATYILARGLMNAENPVYGCRCKLLDCCPSCALAESVAFSSLVLVLVCPFNHSLAFFRFFL